MASRLQRILAAVEVFLHDHLWMDEDGTFSSQGSEVYYRWNHWGRRCAIIDSTGRVKHLGYSWAVRHRYDANEKLLSRLPMRKWAEPGDRVLYGREADDAHSNEMLQAPKAS